MNTTIKRSDVRALLMGLHGQFFTVDFVKRSTGEARTMNASLNYRSLKVGGQAKYNASEKNLLVVRDEGKDAIRSIPLDAVLRIRCKGNSYSVED